MKPSTSRILARLRDRGGYGLTSNEAHLIESCDRLAARVHELRACGFEITKTYETHGEATFARYVLIEAPRQLTLLDPADRAPEVPPRGGRSVQRAERPLQLDPLAGG